MGHVVGRVRQVFGGCGVQRLLALTKSVARSKGLVAGKSWAGVCRGVKGRKRAAGERGAMVRERQVRLGRS